MKTLLIASTLFVASLSTPVLAVPSPPSGCTAISSSAVTCTDVFGNSYRCVLRDLIFIMRWDCDL